jgi:hypothetical protein
MRYELQILRAVVRMARRGCTAGVEDLRARVGGSPGDVRAALRQLDGQGLLTRTLATEARPTLAGLALCVALSDTRKRARPARRNAATDRAA